MKEKTVTSTWTFSVPKYPEWYVREMIQFVRDVVDEKTAVENFKKLLENYKKKLTIKELLKLLFKRL